MDRAWAVAAAVMLWIALILAYFGSWLLALGAGLLGIAILALLALDDICLVAGSVSYLRAGRVWSLTIGNVRLWGINWRMRLSMTEAE